MPRDIPMRALLVGNYPFDGATSMNIWCKALERELRQLGIDVRLIAPRPLLGNLKPSARGIGKWLGYIDRFVFFPIPLRAAAANADIVHICDHGGAMYAPMIGAKAVLVTCHDMIAVRSARGEIPQFHSSLLGKLLQRWICYGLRRASCVACVSHATYEDVRRILTTDRKLCVVLNGLNYPYQPIAPSDADRRLKELGGISAPFVLHVGSNLPYKNREGMLRIFARASAGINLQLVIAGEPLNDQQAKLARELQIETRLIQFGHLDSTAIQALYTRAVCLLFPSRYEGFGWPPIEAQACGCPVVASDIPPFVETIGGSAILKALGDEDGMASAIRMLISDETLREELRQRGFENVHSRFSTERMIKEYLDVYKDVIGSYNPRASGFVNI